MTPPELLKAMFQAAVDAALPSLCVPAHLPQRPKGRTIVIGAGKASGAMAKALEDAWDGSDRGPGRDAIRLSRADGAARSGRGRPSRARCRGPRGRNAHLQARPGTDRGRSCALPDLGRRLGAARASAQGLDARGQAGGEQGPAQERRHDLGDEHGAEASLGHQGRQACRGGGPGKGRRADDLRRARRRSFDHRFGPDRARPLDQRGCARHHREVQDRCARHPCASG